MRRTARITPATLDKSGPYQTFMKLWSGGTSHARLLANAPPPAPRPVPFHTLNHVTE
jgi:hypothetical protein